ncbi:hypothetical protein QYE76_046481 [Lolium multiflorum]|uniref:Uncharacterized protein n=1 Tax=Lolium multiflorum TaxID=4521 RepID=A0AAD8TPL5_LOLMU|nr:hypothetical protein QYE76_046481 [Lolium multiflorum]
MVRSRHPEVDDPLRIPTDAESLVLSGHGRPHGRFPFLNKAVKPTPATSYTRLKHTLTADSPQPRPRPARPPAYDEMMISMSTGTPPPARVTVAGDMPIMPSRAAFAATYYGSTPEGTCRERDGPGTRHRRVGARSHRFMKVVGLLGVLLSVDYSWDYSRCLSVDFSWA